MKALFCMSFDKKTEWIDDGQQLVENPLGTALLTLLATDFNAFSSELAVQLDDLDHPVDREKLAEAVAAKIRPLHPFFESALRPMFFEEQKMLGLRYRILEMQRLRLEFSALVDEVFLADERNGSPLQQLCMQQSRDKMLAAELAQKGRQNSGGIGIPV